MPVSVHMALQFLQNGGEEAEKVYDNVRKHQDPLTNTTWTGLQGFVSR